MTDIISQMGSLAEAFLSKHAAKLSKSFKTRFIETLILYVVMQKTNFTQLATFGSYNEKTYRNHFEKGGADTVAFNLGMAKDYFKDSIGIKALAIDPCYISKTGKHTPGLGLFWSGSAGQAKWGLEMLGVGIVDTFFHECFMLGGFHLQQVAQTECQGCHLDFQGQEQAQDILLQRPYACRCGHHKLRSSTTRFSR